MALRKSIRLRAIGDEGADISSVQQAGLTCDALWGAPVAGIAPTSLQLIRISAAKSLGPFKPGSSNGFKFGLAQQRGYLDPGVSYAVSVVTAWSEAVRSGQPALSLLQCVLQDSPVRIQAATSWNSVLSPAALMSKMCLFLGWCVHSASEIGTHSFGRINLFRLPPRALAELARGKARDAYDVDALRRQDAGWHAPVFWKPLVELTVANRGWLGPHERAV